MKNFLLRGGAEHCNFKFSQLNRSFEADGSLHFTYTENSSKNRCGGFNQLNVENKVVHQYQDLQKLVVVTRTCFTCISARFQDDIFYLRPLAKVLSDPSAPWFMCTAVGKNTLSKKLAEDIRS